MTNPSWKDNVVERIAIVPLTFNLLDKVELTLFHGVSEPHFLIVVCATFYMILKIVSSISVIIVLNKILASNKNILF